MLTQRYILIFAITIFLSVIIGICIMIFTTNKIADNEEKAVEKQEDEGVYPKVVKDSNKP